MTNCVLLYVIINMHSVKNLCRSNNMQSCLFHLSDGVMMSKLANKVLDKLIDSKQKNNFSSLYSNLLKTENSIFSSSETILLQPTECPRAAAAGTEECARAVDRQAIRVAGEIQQVAQAPLPAVCTYASSEAIGLLECSNPAGSSEPPGTQYAQGIVGETSTSGVACLLPPSLQWLGHGAEVPAKL